MLPGARRARLLDRTDHSMRFELDWIPGHPGRAPRRLLWVANPCLRCPTEADVFGLKSKRGLSESVVSASARRFGARSDPLPSHPGIGWRLVLVGTLATRNMHKITVPPPFANHNRESKLASHRNRGSSMGFGHQNMRAVLCPPRQ